MKGCPSPKALADGQGLFTEEYIFGIKYRHRFEFDPAKSQLNKQKHGIDFIDVQVLWFGAFVEFSLNTTTEIRCAVIGQIDGMFWTAVITYREERIRIISVRRSRDEEKQAYKARAKANPG